MSWNYDGQEWPQEEALPDGRTRLIYPPGQYWVVRAADDGMGSILLGMPPLLVTDDLAAAKSLAADGTCVVNWGESLRRGLDAGLVGRMP